MSVKEISFDGVRMRVLLGEGAGAGLTILDETAPPGMSPPPHAHLGMSETFYVLEGSYQFVVDGDEQMVGAGEMVSVPPGMTHWWTAGSHGARSLIIFVPGGIEGYFAELADALREAGDEPLEEAFHLRMRDRFGMEMRR